MDINIIEKQELEEIKDTLKFIQDKIKYLTKNKAVNGNWIDNQEASEYLKVRPRTLQNYRDNKTLPFTKLGGKVYYKLSDIEAMLEKSYSKKAIEKKSQL